MERFAWRMCPKLFVEVIIFSFEKTFSKFRRHFTWYHRLELRCAICTGNTHFASLLHFLHRCYTLSHMHVYYGYQLSKAGRKFVEKFSRSSFDVVTDNWLRFQWRPVGFDVNDCKAREIAGDDIVTIGNKESCPWQHQNLNAKTFQRTFVPPYSTDNRSNNSYRSGGKYPSLSPTLRWIIVLVYTTRAELLADLNVVLCVTSGRKFKNLSRRLFGGE